MFHFVWGEKGMSDRAQIRHVWLGLTREVGKLWKWEDLKTRHPVTIKYWTNDLAEQRSTGFGVFNRDGRWTSEPIMPPKFKFFICQTWGSKYSLSA